MQFPRTLHLIETGQLGVIDGCACGSEVPLGQVQVDGSGFEVSMPQQCLHGRQIGSSFHQMSGETVTQGIIAMLMNFTQRRSAIVITLSTA